MTHIYGLVDPVSKQLRYVGATKYPIKRRVLSHLKRAAIHPDRPIYQWVLGLRSEGHDPEFIEIEQVENDWPERERFWIEYYRSVGADLLNVSRGGPGGGHPTTEEEKANLRAVHTGRMFSDEMRGRIAKAREETAFGMRTHCTHGHELSEDNIYRGKRGTTCMACNRISALKSYHRRNSNIETDGKPMPLATHCSKDHEFTPENTAIYRGSRQCRECNRERAIASYYRNRAKPSSAQMSQA